MHGTKIDHRVANPPAPDFPPWGYASSPELAHILGVSLQTIFNRRLRGQLPPSVQCRSRRHYYRLADVLSLSNGAMPERIIADWINARFPGVIAWAQGPDQNPALGVALDRAIAYLERNRLVPATRKPQSRHVPKFASPIREGVPCPT